MEILAAVLLIIFVLHLVDKHNRWRQTLRGAMWVALVCAVIAGSAYGWIKWNTYRAEKKKESAIASCVARTPGVGAIGVATVRSACEAHPDFALDMTTSVPISPRPEHPVWIYIDIAEEFGGYVATRPVVPSQIEAMIKDGRNCVPGSTTYGPDKIEWVCIRPDPIPEGLPSGFIRDPH